MVWQRAVLILFSTANALLHLSQSVMKRSKKVIGLDQGSSQFTLSSFLRWSREGGFLHAVLCHLNEPCNVSEPCIVQLSPMCFPKLVSWWCADLISQISFAMNTSTFRKYPKVESGTTASGTCQPPLWPKLRCSYRTQHQLPWCLSPRLAHTWAAAASLGSRGGHIRLGSLGVWLFGKYIEPIDTMIVDHMEYK